MPNFAFYRERRKATTKAFVRVGSSVSKKSASPDLRMAGFSPGASDVADRIHWLIFTAETSISAMHTKSIWVCRGLIGPRASLLPAADELRRVTWSERVSPRCIDFCFLFLVFSLILPTVRISFLFYSLVFIGDSTDPGLLKIRLTSLVCCCGFCLYKCWPWGPGKTPNRGTGKHRKVRNLMDRTQIIVRFVESFREKSCEVQCFECWF